MDHRIGIVGVGGAGRALFSAVDRIGNAHITAACDIDEAALAKVANEHGISETFTSLDDMLKTNVDVVLLATPIQVHGEQSIAALKAGKHVLCQYIAANDMREATEVLRLVNRTGLKYMYIETDCYEPKNILMMELARKGVLGEPTIGRGHYVHDCKTMGRREDGSLTWRGELWMAKPTCGTNAVHTCQPLLEVFGERVHEVYTYGPGARTLPEYQVHDRFTSICHLPSGKIIELESDFLSWRPVRTGYTLQGTRGIYEFDRAAIVEGEKTSDWKDMETLAAEYNVELPDASAGHGSAWYACITNLLTAIDTDTQPPQNIHDALHITAIGWAADESIRTGRLVSVRQFE